MRPAIMVAVAAYLAADHARLAARCVDMLHPAAVHHSLDLVAVLEDCDLALLLPHERVVAMETPRSSWALAGSRPRLLGIQCRKTADLVAAEVVEYVEVVASRLLLSPPMQKAVDLCNASSPHSGRQLRRQ